VVEVNFGPEDFFWTEIEDVIPEIGTGSGGDAGDV